MYTYNELAKTCGTPEAVDPAMYPREDTFADLRQYEKLGYGGPSYH